MVTGLVVRMEVEGGLAFMPGLSKPFELDTADLEPADAANLRALLTEADFFNLSAEPKALAPGSADHREYTITVTENERTHTVRLTDPVDSPALRRLVGQLTAWRRDSRR
jgi:hypothetical protein